MSNKELIEDVAVNDRTNNSLKTAEDVCEGCLQGSRPSAVIVPEKRKRFFTQEKMELVRLTYLHDNTVSSVLRAHGVAPTVLLDGVLSISKALSPPYRRSNGLSSKI